MSRSLEASFLFDNPVVGREIRIGLRPGMIAITATGYAAFLLATFWVAYGIYRVQVARFVETLDFGMLAFLLIMVAQFVLCSIIVPFRACGFLDRERKDRSLDQFLVSGYSPYAALLGKLGISFVFSLILISIGIPFAILCYQAGGVPAGTIVRAFVVLIVYNLFLLSFAIALSTQIPDLAATLSTTLGVQGIIILSHLESTPTALRALSPIQHILWDFEGPLSGVGYVLQQTTFFAQPVAPWALSVFYFLSLSVLSAFVAVMGPEIPIITGLHVYGETRAPAGAKRKKTRSLFARSSELAFLYENRPGWLRRNDFLVREVVIGTFLVLLVVALMGTLWPPTLAPFDKDTFLYSLCLFTFVLVPLLALTGLRGQRAFARTVAFGRRSISAVTVSRLAFIVKALVPLGCAALAFSLTSRTHFGDGFERYVSAYFVVLVFSLFLFAVFLAISIRTQSPGRAVIIGILIAAAVATLPLLWFYGYHRFWWGPETHAAAELSPLLAVFGALQPDQSISFARVREGIGPMGGLHEAGEFYPDPRLFLFIYGPLAIAVLVIGDRWIRRRLRSLGTAAVVLAVLLGGAAEARAQAEEEEVKLQAEFGFDGVVTGPWMPVTVKVVNKGPTVKGTLRITLTGDRRGMWAYPITIPEGGEKRVQKVLASPVEWPRYMFAGPWWVRGGMWSPMGISADTGEVQVTLEEGGRVLAKTEPMTPDARVWAGMFTFTGGSPGDTPASLITLDLRGPHTAQLAEDIATAAFAVSEHGAPIHVEAWALPDSPAGYKGLGGIVLGNVPLEQFSARQRRAIRIWVERGGTLVLTPRRLADTWRGTFLEEVSGLTGLVYDRERDLSRLTLRYRIPFDDGEPRALTADLSTIPGDILIGGEDSPLAVRVPVGKGHLVLAAFDPWAPPIRGWKGGRRLLQDLAGEGHLMHAQPFFNLMLPATQTPRGGIGSTLMFGLLFLICVGPGAYLVLRLRKRPRAIWLAVPVISLFFGVAGVAVSPLARVEPSLCIDAAVLELYPDSARGVASRYLLYLSSGRERHNLALRGDEPSVKLWQASPYGFTPREIEIPRPGAAEARVDPLRVNRWGSRLVHGEVEFRLDGRVEAHIEKGKGVITIRVANRSSLDLTDAFVRFRYSPTRDRDFYHAIGDLPAGGSYEKEIPLEGSEETWIKAYLVASDRVSQEVVDVFLPSTGVIFGRDVLIARLAPEVGDGILSPELDEWTIQRRLPSFLVVPLETARPGKGKFFLANLPRKILPLEARTVASPVGGAMMTVEPWIPCEFRAPPLPEEAAVEKIWVRTTAGGAATLGSPIVEIYDWVAEEWKAAADLDLKERPASPSSTEVWYSLREPSRYLLRPEGVVLIRGGVPTGQGWWNWPQIKPPDLTLEGTVGE